MQTSGSLAATLPITEIPAARSNSRGAYGSWVSQTFMICSRSRSNGSASGAGSSADQHRLAVQGCRVEAAQQEVPHGLVAPLHPAHLGGALTGILLVLFVYKRKYNR